MPANLPFPAANRRRFLAGTGSAFAALVASGCSTAPRIATALTGSGYGPLQADPAGYMDLPRGFSYRVISALGDAMDDGGTVPDKADGMGCFDLGGGKIALVRNHELITTDDAGGDIAAGFDRREGKVLPGGTTNLVLDANTLDIERQFRSLGGTIRNCSGGVTPWGSWLTCEEAPVRPGERYGDGLGKDHGWVFEVPADASALVNPEPLKAMGRFNHEAAAVDPATGIVYLTEDRDDSMLYRFVPAVRGKLSEGGKLQALKLTDGTRDSRNWDGIEMPVARKYAAEWVGIQDVESPGDDLRQQGAAKGGLLVARGEGIHLGDGEFYFCATNGGAAKLGQVFRLVPGRGGAADTLELFFESSSPDQFNYGDNLTVGPNGHLVVCEDQYTDVVTNHLRGISPQGQAYPIALLHEQTELAGACFSPDGRTLFVNAYSPAKTLAITGPW
ncbi:alkaline phosphatase PhoX [Qipengyuania atrilutea]|uniref:DUF839 domain-containing protein n=1 Tax=Qipengyuania atrilutea TaxID=2744473 RepID=A0A850HEQ3_9SPHN|nr:alkaline phosphatase PhoX [Actirhodobacter atriluteus]NVD45729.1 DUF839 domain-containing protein [Actirhodobacter atriluteus]